MRLKKSVQPMGWIEWRRGNSGIETQKSQILDNNHCFVQIKLTILISSIARHKNARTQRPFL
jgi:hypothetical protein